MTVFAWIVGVCIVLFTVRRFCLWAASCLQPRAIAPDRSHPVAVLVAARNESSVLGRLLSAIDRLDYPKRLLHIVLVSDASEDSTVSLMRAWADGKPQVKVLDLPHRHGKAKALQCALAAAPPTSLVAVFDADTEPAPDALAWLAGGFADPRVGAVCGYPEPAAHESSAPARYAALERWVYHLVILAGKDRLGFDPPTVGAICAIRREALIAAGGFPSCVSAEDIWVSMALKRKGWRTRWVQDAVAREEVASSVRAFWLQRIRWCRGLISSRRVVSTLEDVAVAAGYLDRLAFTAGVVLAFYGKLPYWLPGLYVAAPALHIYSALSRAGARPKWIYVLSAIPMLVADVAVTAAAVLTHLARMPLHWDEPRSVDARNAPAPNQNSKLEHRPAPIHDEAGKLPG